MADKRVGPYQRLVLANGREASWYMLPFDRDGDCSARETRRSVLESAESDVLTDVFIFSHGWNNDWAAATRRYQSFVDGFADLHAGTEHVGLDPDYAPLLVGVFWPSVILVSPFERAPAIAAAGAGSDMDELIAALPSREGTRLNELLASDGLGLTEAHEVAEIAAGLYSAEEHDAPANAAPPAGEELVALWTALATDQGPREPDSFGTVDDRNAGRPTAAAFSLDPRNVARALTVRVMKDRAGTVGARGVGPLIADLLGATQARIHLVGHSYGCKVCLSALWSLPQQGKVDSVLLLQPAVNHRCFAVDADGRGNPGGYRSCLDRVKQPVITTYSAHDTALTRWFHTALRRRTDQLEVALAPWPQPPSAYAALGGFGPHGLADEEVTWDELHEPGDRYRLEGSRVLAVDGSRGISDHSDISNSFTWWALYDQVAGP